MRRLRWGWVAWLGIPAAQAGCVMHGGLAGARFTDGIGSSVMTGRAWLMERENEQSTRFGQGYVILPTVVGADQQTRARICAFYREYQKLADANADPELRELYFVTYWPLTGNG